MVKQSPRLFPRPLTPIGRDDRVPPRRPRRHPPLCDALDMATAQEIKLFGKWTFDDVEVSPSRARRSRRDVARRARDVARTIDRDAVY